MPPSIIESTTEALRRDRTMRRDVLAAFEPHLPKLVQIVEQRELMDELVTVEECFRVSADFLDHLATSSDEDSATDLVEAAEQLRELAKDRMLLGTATDEELLAENNLSVASCDLLSERKLTFKILLTTEPGTLLPRTT